MIAWGNFASADDQFCDRRLLRVHDGAAAEQIATQGRGKAHLTPGADEVRSAADGNWDLLKTR